MPATIYSGEKSRTRAAEPARPDPRRRARILIKACTASDINLLIAPPLKVSDCSQITDGAERFLISNIGGSVRTSVVVVWEAF